MKPDSRKCEWSFLSERTETAPDIQFTPIALKWIKAIVDEHNGEVGFLGLVEEISGAYVITEVFYPKHCLVTSTTCEIAPEGEVELAQRLIDENRAEDVAKVRFWGHSHHTMGTTPSGQDDTQALEKMRNNGAYFIRAICNKSGEMSVSFFDHTRQLKFENVKWSVCNNYDAIMQDVISAVNMELNNEEKVQAIRKAVSPKINFTDKEYKDIVERVKELKKENIPAPTVQSRSLVRDFHHGSFNRGGPYPHGASYMDQGDMFDEDVHFGPHSGGWPGRSYGPHMGNFQSVNHGIKNGKKKNHAGINVQSEGPLLSNEEIDAVVNESWEGADSL